MTSCPTHTQIHDPIITSPHYESIPPRTSWHNHWTKFFLDEKGTPHSCCPSPLFYWKLPICLPSPDWLSQDNFSYFFPFHFLSTLLQPHIDISSSRFEERINSPKGGNSGDEQWPPSLTVRPFLTRILFHVPHYRNKKRNKQSAVEGHFLLKDVEEECLEYRKDTAPWDIRSHFWHHNVTDGPV